MHDICAAYAHFLCPLWAAPRGGPPFLFLCTAPLLFFPAAAIIILPIEHGPDLRAFLLAGIAGAHLTQVGVAAARRAPPVVPNIHGATPRKRAPPLTEPPPAPQPHTVLTAKQHARLHNCTEDERIELEMWVADEQVPARGIAMTILQLQPGSASGVKTSSMRGWGISSVGRGCRGEAATQCG
ncbi:hypothetical protein C8J57DRAFT_1408033 [Mycena rebaudengoi]|nr:hypothetical protein C8J57DRAFT_1408033 [Mycena rebaudengoi]